ncbi:hypothetical protein SAMD00019534_024330 [Acytostelium subglobosum LB1]|uniref:hypothetical protein n=1 Tax=Acytostelium subglobosum LB1 TaxID=1410327 RepID=UPI00064518A7|nr:hypothetical protein SAMD00019534_024330 [Acytostelium subglobosum LB1]GAM19258.1 hypothetical protein SAMD00019534_024330 [Acytostelium subglobosum LB1]|eukprot:XP_012757185.1 hypothetical protein SAMD00019534_024330 [Acytostelium subglobosum LB1]
MQSLNDLSNVLLKHVVRMLGDNPVDVICLSLTCRRMYGQRQQYITFEYSNYFSQTQRLIPMYRDLIKKQIDKDVLVVDLKVGSMLRMTTTPETMTHITFDEYRRQLSNSDQSSSSSSSVKSCECIYFGEVEYISPGILPDTLKMIRFNRSYDLMSYNGQPVLPPNLIILILGDGYNQRLPPNALPSSLTSLLMGANFNQPIDIGVLPQSLKIISLGMSYNLPIGQGVLPESLRKLIFGKNYNSPIMPDVLPHSITNIIFGRQFNQPLDIGVLPNSLSILSLGDNFDQTLARGVLPEGLKELSMNVSHIIPRSLPSTLVFLKLMKRFDQPVTPETFPRSLTKLLFSFQFNNALSVGAIPPGVTKLVLEMFNQPLHVGELPDTITELRLGMYDHPLPPDILPDSLKSLDLGAQFNKSIEIRSLPSSLTVLRFGVGFDMPLPPGVLPPSLTELVLGHNYKRKFEQGSLPASLAKLTLGSKYTHSLSASILPVSLTNLTFSIDHDGGSGHGSVVSTTTIILVIATDFFKTYTDKFTLDHLYNWMIGSNSMGSTVTGKITSFFTSWLRSSSNRVVDESCDRFMAAVAKHPIELILSGDIKTLPNINLNLKQLTIYYNIYPPTKFMFKSKEWVKWLMDSMVNSLILVDGLFQKLYIRKIGQCNSNNNQQQQQCDILVLNHRLEGGTITSRDKLESLLSTHLEYNLMLNLD